MGFAAPQARLGLLTQRQHTIRNQLTILANDKINLTRASERNSLNYCNAMNAKKYMWSCNAGNSYADLTYNTLMRPSQSNQYQPYLLTDYNGRVVLDDKYAEIARIISPNGTPGDWESVRTKVLSKATGISEDKINSQGQYGIDVNTARDALESLVEPTPPYKTNLIELIGKAGTSTGSSSANKFSQGNNWAEAYSRGATISLGTGNGVATAIDDILKHLNNTIGVRLANPDKFEQAFQKKSNEYKTLINSASELNGAVISGDKTNGYKINVKGLIDELLGAYAALGGKVETSTVGGNEITQYPWFDIGSDEHNAYLAEKEAYDKEYAANLAAYNAALNGNNTILTAEEENLLKFYDLLFSSVAEKGWVLNSQVNDSTYLNQLLQNGTYSITTVSREQNVNPQTQVCSWQNDYVTDIASNCTNIFAVNDEDAINLALAEYEHQKALINAKEARIDTRMSALKTEDEANAQIIKQLESRISDSVEQTMNLQA